MSTVSQSTDSAMPLLSVIAARTTIGVCVLFVFALVVMNFQSDMGQLLTLPAMLGWFIASWVSLFGVVQAKPKKKAFNVFMFSLLGPLVSILVMVILTMLFSGWGRQQRFRLHQLRTSSVRFFTRVSGKEMEPLGQSASNRTSRSGNELKR